LISYGAVLDHRIHRGIFEDVIPGVLKSYDLPDLPRLVTPRALRIVDAVNPVGQRLPLDTVRAAYSTAKVLRRGAADTAASLYGFSEKD
jgi:hypothetical protein